MATDVVLESLLDERGRLLDRRAAVISLLRSIKSQMTLLRAKPLFQTPAASKGAVEEAEGLLAKQQRKLAGVKTTDWRSRGGTKLLSWRGRESDDDKSGVP